jgi:O-antigen/teichoic acid export membrane protein
LIPHAAAGVLLSSADRFIVSVAIGPAELGVYGASAQLGAVMALLADSFSKSFGPWLYERLNMKEPTDELRAIGAIYVSAPVLLLVAAALCGVLIPVGAVLLGPAYSGALLLLPWFVAGGAFMGMYLAVANLYFFNGRTGLLSTVTVPASLAGAAATVWLVRHFGIDGAAAGFALTQVLLACGAWLVAGFSFALPWRRPGAALAALRRGVPAVRAYGRQP